MKRAHLALLFAASLAAQVKTPPLNTLTPQEKSGGWILLFDGKTFNGWTQEEKAQWRIADGSVIADAGDAGWLRYNKEFKDFLLKVDFRTAADGNSGVFLRSGLKQPAVSGYELQIFDTQPAGYQTGSLVNHVKLVSPPKIKPNEWMSYDIEVRGNYFVVKLDGVQILTFRDTMNTSLSGFVGLQYNKDKPVAFRNVKLKPL